MRDRLARHREERHLRPRRRARDRASAARESAQAGAPLIRLLRAVVVALLGTALGYVLLGAVLAVSAGWSHEVALDQAIGLAVHAGIVFVRGVLPAVLVTGIACLLWRRRRGLDPGAFATLAVSIVLAAPIAFFALTWPIRPHLRVGGAADAITTYALLAAVAAGAELLARRRTRRSVAPDRPGPP